MAMGRRNFRETRGPQIRINHRIRVPEVRVVLDDGTMLGVMSTQEALRKAEERNLDLVEINPKSNPPVCKILDFGKYKYEEKKRASEAKKKQTVVELKEVKLRPKTDDHDLETKLRAARRFLTSGNKVKFTVRFRGREITHPERARMQLDWILEKIADLANLEQRPTMEGRTMSLIIAPKPQVIQRLQSGKAAAGSKDKDKAARKDGTSSDSSADSSRSPDDVDDDDLDDDDDYDDDDDDLDDDDDDEGDDDDGDDDEDDDE
jgi:translation initiation factor IF-3